MIGEIMKRKVLVFLFGIIPSLVTAQSSYPSRPVRIIVPFAPGGASDFVARIMQPRLTELLGQPIVVENKPGAAGNIGVDTVAKSAPDGYTVFLGNVGSIAINPGVFPNLQVNPLRDLVAVSQVVDVPSVLVVHPSLPVNSLKELVAYAKANPGKLNYGSPGSGSLDRLEMEVLRKLENLDMVHVPYKGGAGPAVAGLMGGETHLMFATAASAMPGVKSGRLKVLAVTGSKRLEQLPAAATVGELGFPDLTASSWQGFFVPTGTPKEVVERLHAVATQVMATPEVVTRLATGGGVPLTSASPAAFGEYVAAETRRWARIAKESNATPD
jgi:tripartite-type tricarboxylate transporter receptor subunit TctC